MMIWMSIVKKTKNYLGNRIGGIKHKEKYKLFLDDERNPKSSDWVIICSCCEAIQYIINNGIPDIMSLDHDLGQDLTGYDFVKKLCIMTMDGDCSLNNCREIIIHSHNTIGAENMNNYLINFFNEFNIQTKVIRKPY